METRFTGTTSVFFCCPLIGPPINAQGLLPVHPSQAHQGGVTSASVSVLLAPLSRRPLPLSVKTMQIQPHRAEGVREADQGVGVIFIDDKKGGGVCVCGHSRDLPEMTPGPQASNG